MHKICFTISVFHASTCFEHHVLIGRSSKLYYTKKNLTELINYYQQMHYIAIKITQITVFYVIIRAPTCFDPSGSSSGSSECPY